MNFNLAEAITLLLRQPFFFKNYILMSYSYVIERQNLFTSQVLIMCFFK